MATEEDLFTAIREPQILKLSGRWAAVLKPAGMHCTGPGTDTLTHWAFDTLPGVAAVSGQGPGEGGLLHRLDRDTSGLVLFALDQGAFDAIIDAASRGLFVKRYSALAYPVPAGLAGSRPELAVPHGVDEKTWLSALRRADMPALVGFLGGYGVESRFRPYGPKRTRVACALPEQPVNAGKDWTTSLYRSQVLDAQVTRDGMMIRVQLCRGFRHQVRAHLAWHGLPLLGDRMYGDGERSLCLLASGMSFPDPESGTIVNLDASHTVTTDAACGADQLANTGSAG